MLGLLETHGRLLRVDCARQTVKDEISSSCSVERHKTSSGLKVSAKRH